MDSATSNTGGWARALPLVVILAVAALGAFLLRDFLNFETLREHREALIGFRDANYTTAIVVFVLVYITIVAFSLPGALIASLTGGFMFGLLVGVLVNMLAATTGATLLFLAARWGLGARLAARMDASSGSIRTLKRGIDDNQWSMLFLMRLIPLVPFFVANLVPALVGVPLHRFAISTFIGIIPGAVVVTSVGAGLGDVFERGESPDLGLLAEPQFLLPILGVSALIALSMVVKFLRGGKNS